MDNASEKSGVRCEWSSIGGERWKKIDIGKTEKGRGNRG